MEPLKERKDIDRIKGRLGSNPRDYSLFMAGIHLGLRASDLLSLAWKDVCGADGKIKVSVSVVEGKTGNTRKIALSPSVTAALDLWRRHSGADTECEVIWPAPDGGPLTIQRLHQLVNAWCRGAGVLGHFGTHTLRKTYGYHLLQNGIGIELLMKVFGHSSEAITLRYVGIEQREIDVANLSLSL